MLVKSNALSSLFRGSNGETNIRPSTAHAHAQLPPDSCCGRNKDEGKTRICGMSSPSNMRGFILVASRGTRGLAPRGKMVRCRRNERQSCCMHSNPGVWLLGDQSRSFATSATGSVEVKRMRMSLTCIVQGFGTQWTVFGNTCWICCSVGGTYGGWGIGSGCIASLVLGTTNTLVLRPCTADERREKNSENAKLKSGT